MGVRHEGREAALCILYQAELAGISRGEALEAFFASELPKELSGSAPRSFAESLVAGVDRFSEELDRLIARGAEHWRMERMAVVDRNVLRLALFELLEQPETPAAVILDEAVELAKHFGGEDSASFVNGVVDGIRRKLESGAMKREWSGSEPE